jgi:hypothetical protein
LKPSEKPSEIQDTDSPVSPVEIVATCLAAVIEIEVYAHQEDLYRAYASVVEPGTFEQAVDLLIHQGRVQKHGQFLVYTPVRGAVA